ncbi:uncharacterized protein LOC110034551 [Phalaenopsis equestris]|uniref:uncharacterized protein LOC110034551 n=1 Tax=Phalaenopsis equestris TaxID=78828 RepID=UPI0009E4004D|nr:uncharacterized protein LOC110034551 [Phalaenopsis equestris]
MSCCSASQILVCILERLTHFVFRNCFIRLVLYFIGPLAAQDGLIRWGRHENPCVLFLESIKLGCIIASSSAFVAGTTPSSLQGESKVLISCWNFVGIAASEINFLAIEQGILILEAYRSDGGSNCCLEGLLSCSCRLII